MITSFILYLLYGFLFVVTGVFRLFPDVALPTQITTAFANAGPYLGTIDQVFPVYDLLGALGIMITVEIAIQLYKATMWTIKKIPGIK